MRLMILFLALALIAAPRVAFANGPTGDPPAGEARALSVTMTPFSGWVPGVDGTVGGSNGAVDVSLSPLDVASNLDEFIGVLDGMYIGWGEVRYGRVGLFYDIYHLDVSSTESIRAGAISLGLDLAFRQTTSTVAATYRLWERGASHWDVLAGVRVSNVDIRIAASLNALGLARGTGEYWTDAVVGTKARYALDPKWSLSGWGLVGAGGSDLTWDLHGALTYAVRPGFDLSAGFRGMKIDYSSSDFTWDVLQYGPVMNATFKF